MDSLPSLIEYSSTEYSGAGVITKLIQSGVLELRAFAPHTLSSYLQLSIFAPDVVYSPF